MHALELEAGLLIRPGIKEFGLYDLNGKRWLSGSRNAQTDAVLPLYQLHPSARTRLCCETSGGEQGGSAIPVQKLR